MKKIRGFTLIEVVVAVAVVGILAAIAVPNYQHMVSKSKQLQGKNDLEYLYTAMKNFWGEHAYYVPRFDAIGFNPEGRINYVIRFGNDVIPKTPLGTATCIATGPPQPAAWVCNYAGGAPIKWVNEQSALNSVLVGGAVTRNGFVASATGRINGVADDVWTIDSNDNLLNITPNL